MHFSSATIKNGVDIIILTLLGKDARIIYE